MSHQNALNNKWAFIDGFCAAPGLRIVKAYINNASSGDNDIYTVPAGRKGYVISAICFNGNGSSATVFAQIKLSGTYFRIENNSTISTLNVATIFPGSGSNGIILDAGEILSFNSNVNNVNVWAAVYEFDSSTLIKTVKFTAFVSGNNTIYTCPANKSFIMLNNVMSVGSNPTGPMIVQTTGSAVSYQIFYVPSGGTATTNTTATAAISINNNVTIAKNTHGPSFSMTSGDSVIISSNSNTAGQLCWLNLIEIDV